VKPGDTEAETIPITLKEGALETELNDPKPGKHEFSFDVVRHRALLADENAEVKFTIEVPKEKPAQPIKANGNDVDFQKLFVYPAGTALVAAFLLALLFHPPAPPEAEGKGKPALPH
jgi:hypothetical protein